MLLRSGIIQSTIVTRNQTAPEGDNPTDTDRTEESSGISGSTSNSSNTRER